MGEAALCRDLAQGQVAAAQQSTGPLQAQALVPADRST